jgi:hypothetical protein
VALSIVRRILREQPIFAADREHIQHRLPDRGPAPRRVALVLRGVEMLSRMVAKNTSWQTLSAPEGGNILAYLNSRKWAAARPRQAI